MSPSTPSTSLASLLPDDFEALVALYFACEEPAEKDVFLDALQARTDKNVDEFLLSIAQQDDDPFVRVAAARALAKRGETFGLSYLREVLAVGSDNHLVGEAAQALVDALGAEAFAELLPIWSDLERELHERELVQAALVRADPVQSAQAFAHALAQGPVRPLSLTELQAMAPALACCPPSWPQAQEGLCVRLRAAQHQQAEAQAALVGLSPPPGAPEGAENTSPAADGRGPNEAPKAPPTDDEAWERAQDALDEASEWVEALGEQHEALQTLAQAESSSALAPA